jgi:hypothetical protein
MPSNSLNNSQIAGSSSGELASSERLNTPETPAGLPEERLNIREELAEIWDQDLLFMSEPEYDEAIIGVMERAGGSPVIAYDTQKILDILERSMPMEDAQEFFEYNILGAYMGDRTPVYITQNY